MTVIMTAAKVTETLVTAGDNSFSVDYSNPDDQTTRSAVTSGFKPFSIPVLLAKIHIHYIWKFEFIGCSHLNTNTRPRSSGCIICSFVSGGSFVNAFGKA